MTHLRSSLSMLILAAVVAVGVGCTSKTQKTEEAPTSSEEGDRETKPEKPRGKTIVLYEYRFNPNTLTISPGTKVTFKNKDQETHRVKIAALDVDEEVDPGENWSYKFETVGEFAVENPDAERPMTLDLVVKEEGSQDQKTSDGSGGDKSSSKTE